MSSILPQTTILLDDVKASSGMVTAVGNQKKSPEKEKVEIAVVH